MDFEPFVLDGKRYTSIEDLNQDFGVIVRGKYKGKIFQRNHKGGVDQVSLSDMKSMFASKGKALILVGEKEKLVNIAVYWHEHKDRAEYATTDDMVNRRLANEEDVPF